MDVKKNKHLGQFPDEINEKQLVQLCEKYRDEIGRGTIKGAAYPRIRYVIAETGSAMPTSATISSR